MHRLQDLLSFYFRNLKKIVKKSHRFIAKCAMFLVMFDVSEWAHTVLEIIELNKQTFV